MSRFPSDFSDSWIDPSDPRSPSFIDLLEHLLLREYHEQERPGEVWCVSGTCTVRRTNGDTIDPE